MKQHLPLYGLAAAIVIVGIAAFGLPLSSLLLLAVVLVCPLMMMFMHGGGGHGGHDAGAVPPDQHENRARAVDRPADPERMRSERK